MIGVDAGAGQIEAADRDRHAVEADAVERDLGRLASDIAECHAGNESQQLTDISVGHRAKLVGGDDVLHVRCEPPLVDRDGGAVHLLGGGHDKRAEFTTPSRSALG